MVKIACMAPSTAGTVGALWEPLTRGFAGFLAAFGAIALILRWVTGFDANLWWVDLRWMPSPLAWLAELVAVVALAQVCVAGPGRGATPHAIRSVAIGFALLTAMDTLRLWWLLARGDLMAAMPVPVSLAIFALWFGVERIAARPETRRFRGGLREGAIRLGSFAAGVVLFPLLQMVCFGWTDYSRPADAVVVPGARVYADGRLSAAVRIRVRTAAALMNSGMATVLVVSGGPGDGAVHEVDAMAAEAIRLGVHPDRIRRDFGGLSSAATVRNALGMVRDGAIGDRLLVVSEYYHLPRLKLAFQLAGTDVRTVPASPEGTGRRWAIPSMARETVAFWAYCLRPLLPAERRA